MTLSLQAAMDIGRLPALAYYFARFVARGCGLGEDDPAALAAALVSTRNLDGDVCVDLAEHAGRALFPVQDATEDADDGPMAPALPDWLAVLRDCPWVRAPGETAPLILDGSRLYLGKYWRFEVEVAAALAARMEPVANLDRVRLASGLAELFPAAVTDEPDWQRVAAAVAVSRRFAVVSGGPGTGKTTTVVKVLALLLAQRPGLRIALAAPTGKAAARLTESIGTGKGRIAAGGALDPAVLALIPEQAQTIHRLLGYGGRGGAVGTRGFRYHEGNPLPLDCLVVDEASMVDLPLMARVLAALPESARLVLLGDRDQLASVEAGNVLGDITGRGQPIRYGAEHLALLADLGAAPLPALVDAVGEPAGADVPPPAAAVALLRKSWRFGADSGIGALARAVNAGDAEAAVALLTPGARADLARLLPAGDVLHPNCIAWAAERFAPVPGAGSPGAALEILEQARVLAALHRGPFGVEALNARIAARLQGLGNADGGEVYHGLPVMVTANDYEVDLYNGDVGLLWREPEGRRLRAHFRAPDGTLRSLSLRQLPPYVPAYALTVHKSQGSEFDEVLLVLPPTPHPLVSRELVYTGITRARKQVTVHTTESVLRDACRARVKRGSALAERLGWPS
jgi:exodeoxyribonuclease V alpha subunit